MSRHWLIPVIWEAAGTYIIEADTKEEAIEKALSPRYPLPREYGYVIDSIRLHGNDEIVEECDEEGTRPWELIDISDAMDFESEDEHRINGVRDEEDIEGDKLWYEE